MLLPTQNIYFFFSCQNPTFCDGTVWAGRIRIRIGFAPWIRFRIETNADPKYCSRARIL